MIRVILIIAILNVAFAGCVQKTFHKTVVYVLNVKDIKNIEKAGVRGRDKPLSWDSDLPMKMNADSSFTATVTYVTGYKFTEVKFVVNDQFELQDQDNRKIIFSDKDTTIYNATFNVKK